MGYVTSRKQTEFYCFSGEMFPCETFQTIFKLQLFRKPSRPFLPALHSQNQLPNWALEQCSQLNISPRPLIKIFTQGLEVQLRNKARTQHEQNPMFDLKSPQKGIKQTLLVGYMQPRQPRPLLPWSPLACFQTLNNNTRRKSTNVFSSIPGNFQPVSKMPQISLPS